MKTKFNIVPVASSFSIDKISYFVNKYTKLLENIGGKFVEEKNIDTGLPTFIFVISGGTEQIIQNFINSNNLTEQTVFLIAHSENNSLPASFETFAKLKQESLKVQLFFLDTSSDVNPAINEISRAAGNSIVRKEMMNSRIGLIDEPSDWLIASSPTAEIVKKIWGPTIETISLDKIFSEYPAIDDNLPEIKKLADNYIKKASKIREPKTKDIIDTVKIYHSLKKIVSVYNLNAITLKCFDIVSKLNTTGCHALSILGDEGIVAACEGDIVSAVTMLWAYKLTGIMPWMANPTNLNIENGTLNLAHCTIPLSLVDKYTIRTHYESDLGTAIEGKMHHSPVTLLRLGGKNMDKIWAARGKIISNTEYKNSCRTQIKVEFENKSMLKQLVNNPLGNHITVIYGMHKEDLESYWNSYICN